MPNNVLEGTPWEVYYRDIRIRCPAVPEPIMDHALRISVREFLRRTLMWQQLIGPHDMPGNVGFYVLGQHLVLLDAGNDWPIAANTPTSPGVPMENVQIIRIYKDKAHGGGLIHERSTNWLDKNVVNWQYATAQYPQYYFLFNSIDNLQGIRYVPMPVRDLFAVMWITAALANPPLRPPVTDSGVGWERDYSPELSNKYRTEIAAGAIAILCTMMDGDRPYPWTNPQLALLKSVEYEEAISKMKIAVIKDHTRMTTVAHVPDVGFA
jgi:hypothetical protein